MPRRCPSSIRALAMLAMVAGCVGPAGAAEPRDERYTGLAFTYYFGAAADAAPPAELSLGAIERTVDLHENASVMHLPVLLVPLAKDPRPLLAPVSALFGAARYIGSRRWLATDATARPDLGAGIAKSLSLPDLGAR